MIAMLHSWSFDLNSNKSFGTLDPSIPIPSHGHPPIVGDEVTSRSPGHSVGPSLVFGIWPLVIRRARPRCAFSSLRIEPVKTVISVKNVKITNFSFCNPLISRVCTVLHINKKFFSSRQKPLCPLCLSPCREAAIRLSVLVCVLCVSLLFELKPKPLIRTQSPL
jgi:hypothetical protein